VVEVTDGGVTREEDIVAKEKHCLFGRELDVLSK
jgi:hypothetical protein